MNRRTRWPMTATRGTHTLHGPFHLEYPSAAKSMGGVVDSGNASSAPQAGRGGTLGLTYRLSPRT